LQTGTFPSTDLFLRLDRLSLRIEDRADIELADLAPARVEILPPTTLLARLGSLALVFPALPERLVVGWVVRLPSARVRVVVVARVRV
jgi:hypothetical protein